MPPLTTHNRIPQVLEPYLYLPIRSSLVLITGVLEASANWVVVQYLSALLVNDRRANSSHPRKKTWTELNSSENARKGLDLEAVKDEEPSASRGEEEGSDEQRNDEYGVVLVSWMRDWEYWMMEGRKMGRIDLQSLAQQKRIVFVDCLTELFENSTSEPSPSGGSQRAPQPVSTTSSGSLHHSSTGTLKPRFNHPKSPSTHSPSTQRSTTTLQPPNASLPALKSTLNHALALLPPNQPRALLLDTPSLLLATSSEHQESTHALLLSLLTDLDPQPRHIIASDLADAPLLQPTYRLATQQSRQHAGPPLPGGGSTHHPVDADPSTVTFSTGRAEGGAAAEDPIALAHAAWVTSLAHRASLVASCRPLETGNARDVGGVVRWGRGGGWWDLGGDGSEDWYDGIEEREVLWHVGKDGAVRVFGRGEE
ncbi:MAG: hypothetical protein M1822_000961 [Bathelium mastoideum]|nr:MAG: hypothetical protein M1822_000961 [Bathelium mastoideum]